MFTTQANVRAVQGALRASFAATLTLTLLTGCAGGRAFRPQAKARQTCVVLSVGAADGLAHLGALKAIRDAGVDVDCVAGTSMGALVGGLYASAPDADPVQRYRDFISLYAKRTTHEAQQTGLLGALLLGGIALATGGALAAVAVAVGVGAGVGVASIDPIQLERTADVYDEFVNHATFETVPVEFVTYYLELTRTGAKMQVADTGPIAAGVQRSIANPLVFSRLDVKEAGYVDPGVDRIAAIPIRDTCERFPKAQLLVINASHQPAELDGVKCPTRVIDLDVSVPPESLRTTLLGQGEAFEHVVQAGYDQTKAALRR